MQKGVFLKKVALQRIIEIRRRNKVLDLEQEEKDDDNDNEGLIQIPNGILPDKHGVNELKDEQHGVNKKAYATMEWWRCTRANN